MAKNIAVASWCGFPKSYDQRNEWFIMNYMVSAAIVCRYIERFVTVLIILYCTTYSYC
jgi:hypothetical protein